MAPKRKEMSDPADVELAASMRVLDNFLKKSRQRRALGDAVRDAAETLLQLLQSKVDASRVRLTDTMNAPITLDQAYSFWDETQDHLDKMNISFSGFLKLKPDTASRLGETDSLGADGLWSADMLYRHIQFLEGLVPQNNEAAARLWINAFLFRVVAMTPSGSNMVVKVEQVVPSVTMSDTSPHAVDGYVNWTAVVMSPEKSEIFLQRPFLRNLKLEDSVLLVSEAKGPNQLLETHVPQALSEMYECARLAAKTTIRGVVTNGRNWIFLILTLNKHGGGSFLRSSVLKVYCIDDQYLTEKVWKGGVSLISSIISHWMMHSHQEVKADDGDYFTQG